MLLNMQILFDNLGDYVTKSNLISHHFDLRAPKLLSTVNIMPSDDYVYILDEAQFRLLKNNLPLCVIVTCVQLDEMEELSQDNHEIITIEWKKGLLELFDEIFQIFEKYNNIETQLMYKVIEDASISSFLNIACHLFNNPIILLDTAMTVVSYTKSDDGGLDLDENVWTSVLHYGHVSINAITYYEKNREKIEINRFENAFFHTINADLYNAIQINIFDGKNRLGRLLIPDDIASLYPGHLGLAEYIAPLLSNIMRRQKVIQNVQQTEIEQFFSRHIDGFHYSDHTILQKYLSKLNWRVAGNFYIMKIVNNGISNNDTFVFNTRKIKSLFSNCISMMYNGACVIIINNGSNRMLLSECMSGLQKIVTNNLILVGISMRFDDMNELKSQYHIVSNTIDLGKKLSPEDKLLCYDEYYIFDLFRQYSENANKTPISALCLPEVSKLFEHDKKCGTDLLQSLFQYLVNERSLLKAAKELHIHRNSLVYRLEKIRDVVSIDFDDPIYRIRLILSCYAIYYYEGRSPKTLIRKHIDRADTQRPEPAGQG